MDSLLELLSLDQTSAKLLDKVEAFMSEKEQIEFRQLMGEEAVQRKSEDNYIEVLNNYNYMENSQMKYELLFEILEDIRIGKHN